VTATAPRRRPWDLALLDQLEAVAVAIAMALVLKYFLVEAFQIPTGSMQPTILGDAQAGIRDRVLADKLTVMLRAPRRWEVMIFRFPNDERALYIKRIVGLPGETLELRGGDVWVDGRIARKPDHVLESVLKEVHPPHRAGAGLDIARHFVPDSPEGLSLNGDEVVFGPQATAELSLRASVRDQYSHGYDPDWGIRGSTEPPRNAVPDLELALTARLDTAEGRLVLRHSADDGELLVTLCGPGVSDPPPLLRWQPAQGPARELAVAPVLRLAAGRDHAVVLRNVDRRVVLTVDGEEWLRVDDDEAGPRADRPALASLAFALAGGGRVTDLRIRRDIHYISDWSRAWQPAAARWEIPEGHYFALGDNTQGSLDSRRWERMTYELKTPVDGRSEITGFWFEAPSVGRVPPDANPKYLTGGRIRFADVHGDEFEFTRDQVAGQRLEAAPFVPERFLLGKATLVFWPVWKPFRWKLIR